jgi:hypothetical protein
LNFLSHFYHEHPVSDPYFAAGIILPDILSNYSHRAGIVVKLHPQKLKFADQSQLNALTAGVIQHHRVDGFFHESTFFEENTAAITARLLLDDFSCFNKRLYAISHVLLELLLDRKILIENRDYCDEMYAMLESVEPVAISALVALNTENGQASGVGNHFKVFTEHKFVYDYMEDARLVGIMNGINTRLGNPAMSTTDKHHFKNAIHDLEKTILSQKFPKFPTDS